MPFDPAYPPTNAEIESAPLRGQFTGLKDLIDAISTITAAQIDSVTTGNPGDPATVGVSLSGATLHFTFGLPRGADGGQGPAGSNGINGNDGTPGATGPQGPPFANAVVDWVTTLNPGDNASVSVSFDGSNVRFQFGIPRGADGSNGTNGTNGSDGAPGAQGPPGEVSNAQLTSAINGTSNNSNGVATLDTAFVNDPPTLADMELMRAKVNELIQALRRV